MLVVLFSKEYLVVSVVETRKRPIRDTNFQNHYRMEPINYNGSFVEFAKNWTKIKIRPGTNFMKTKESRSSPSNKRKVVYMVLNASIIISQEERRQKVSFHDVDCYPCLVTQPWKIHLCNKKHNDRNFGHNASSRLKYETTALLVHRFKLLVKLQMH